jgi:hypothetical protein
VPLLPLPKPPKKADNNFSHFVPTINGSHIGNPRPLNYLVWIEIVGILPLLYRKVLIPPQVLDEVLSADAPPAVQAWAKALPPWIEVHPPAAMIADPQTSPDR